MLWVPLEACKCTRPTFDESQPCHGWQIGRGPFAMLASRFADSLRFLLLAMLAGLALIAVAGTAVTGLPRGGLGNQYPSDPSDVRGVRPHFAFRDDWVVQPDFDLGSRPLKPCWSLGKLTRLVAWRVVVLGPTVNSGLGAAFSFFNVWLRVLYRVSSIKLVLSQQSCLTLLPL